MKKLLILRHGKAERESDGGDKHRPLAPKGMQQAAAIGASIRDIVGVPDVIVTSDATRAHQTAQIAANEMGYGSVLTMQPAIYEASVETLIDIVRSLPDDAASALIVGHNPGFEGLVWRLAKEGGGFVSLPTGCLAAISFDVSAWAEIDREVGEIEGIYRG